MAEDERIQNIIEALEELSSDGSVPRNIKSKVEIILLLTRIRVAYYRKKSIIIVSRH